MTSEGNQIARPCIASFVTPLLDTFAAGVAADGDMLSCGGEHVRLARIHTPERYEAGFQAAKDHMDLLVRGKEVRCVVRKREKYGGLLGECSVAGVPSLSDEMLRRGLTDRHRGKRRTGR